VKKDHCFAAFFKVKLFPCTQLSTKEQFKLFSTMFQIYYPSVFLYMNE